VGLVSRLRGLLFRERAGPPEAPPPPAPSPPAGPPWWERRGAALAASARAFFRIRGSVGRTATVLLGLLPVVAVLVLWWLVTLGAAPEARIVSPAILPSPAEVVRSFPSLWFDRELMRSLVTSLARVVGGFLVAAAVALPLGIAMGAFSRVKALFQPMAAAGSYLPIAAIVPLTLMWFGTGEKQKVMFLAIASFVVLLPLVVKAIDGVDSVYLNTAYTLGASRWQSVRKVLLGIAWPDIFDALRLTFGVGWAYIILAEIVAAERGLGNLIIGAQRRGPREHIYLVLVVIVLMAFLADRLFLSVARLLFPYRGDRR